MRYLLSTLIILGCFFTASAQRKTARFNHAAIFVTDLKKTTDFYLNVIQLDTIPCPFKDGLHTWFSIGAGIELHVIAKADMPKEYFKNNHLCFSVPSMEVFVKKLNDLHIPFENIITGEKGKLNTRPDGVHQLWFQDPDGYWLEINDVKY